jgi:hypothetical protein
METTKLNFYRVTRYTDPTGHFKVEMEFGLVGMEIMGKFTTMCEGFPKASALMGPFDPKGIEEIQNVLREEEKRGEISNLKYRCWSENQNHTRTGTDELIVCVV